MTLLPLPIRVVIFAAIVAALVVLAIGARRLGRELQELRLRDQQREDELADLREAMQAEAILDRVATRQRRRRRRPPLATVIPLTWGADQVRRLSMATIAACGAGAAMGLLALDGTDPGGEVAGPSTSPPAAVTSSTTSSTVAEPPAPVDEVVTPVTPATTIATSPPSGPGGGARSSPPPSSAPPPAPPGHYATAQVAIDLNLDLDAGSVATGLSTGLSADVVDSLGLDLPQGDDHLTLEVGAELPLGDLPLVGVGQVGDDLP